MGIAIAYVFVIFTGLAVLVGLWQDARFRRRTTARLDQIEADQQHANAQMREALAAYKLEVAKSYASIGLLKDVERRLTEVLIRIESKIGRA